MKKVLFFILSAAVFLLLIGCKENAEQTFSNNSSVGGKPLNTSSNQEENVQYNKVFNDEMVIYQLSRDVFETFLKNPQYDFLKIASDEIYVYNNENEIHITSSTIPFKIDDVLISFVGSQDAIKRYLNESDIDTDIVCMGVIDAPNIPITIWIKTLRENVFVTIDEDDYGAPHIYKLYKLADFEEKYAGKTGKLIIGNKEIVCKSSPKLYYDYADIPLKAVLQAFGAEITGQGETQSIKIKGKTYILDIANGKLYREENKDENMFYQTDGGCVFIYPNADDIMLDDATLSSVLYQIGEKRKIKIDKTKGAVIITDS